MAISDEAVEAARGVLNANSFYNISHELTRLALSAADAVRSRTHVCVPREPTIEMIEAGYLAARRERVTGVGGQTGDACLRRDAAREIAAYRAMIAAVEPNPPPPTQEPSL